eukprot:scaffold17073_cov128-Isochrysis_galbana.AAC.3
MPSPPFLFPFRVVLPQVVHALVATLKAASRVMVAAVGDAADIAEIEVLTSASLDAEREAPAPRLDTDWGAQAPPPDTAGGKLAPGLDTGGGGAAPHAVSGVCGARGGGAGGEEGGGWRRQQSRGLDYSGGPRREAQGTRSRSELGGAAHVQRPPTQPIKADNVV